MWYACSSDPVFPYEGMVLVACREDFVKPMGNPPEPLHLAEKGMLKVMDSDALSTYLFPSLGGVRIPYQVVVRTRFRRISDECIRQVEHLDKDDCSTLLFQCNVACPL